MQTAFKDTLLLLTALWLLSCSKNEPSPVMESLLSGDSLAFAFDRELEIQQGDQFVMPLDSNLREVPASTVTFTIKKLEVMRCNFGGGFCIRGDYDILQIEARFGDKTEVIELGEVRRPDGKVANVSDKELTFGGEVFHLRFVSIAPEHGTDPPVEVYRNPTATIIVSRR